MAVIPNHGRYVGAALKLLPSDTILPWHRVVNAQGELAFPYASEHYNRQKSLLEAEGIQFNSTKICLNLYQWQHN
ncbi:MAG: MGMT family protein [Gammaproteobacteria bacterium]|nr:MGMT family protein [Gammaproteobacteria bacterium]